MRLRAPTVRLWASILGLSLLGPLTIGSAADGLPDGSKAVAPVTPSLPAAVASAIQEGRFAEADEALDRLSRAATDLDTRAYFDLIRGVALRQVGRADEARDLLARSILANPKGAWAPKTRADLASILLAQGKADQAEALARAEVESLLAPDRKDRLAGIYRGFAERLLTTSDPLAKPDPGAAHELLLLARVTARGPSLRAQLLFEIAEASRQAGDFRGGEAEYQSYLDEYPQGPNRDAARFFLGECQAGAGQVVNARLTWSDLARQAGGKVAPGSSGFEARALYKLARTYGSVLPPPRPRVQAPQSPQSMGGFQSVQFGGMKAAPAPALALALALVTGEEQPMTVPGIDADLTLQVTALRRLMAMDPTNPLAVRAAYDVARSYRSRGKSQDALKAYRAFLDGEGFRAESDEARRVLAERTMLALFEVGEVLDAQGKPDEAIATWENYLARYPNGPGSAQAQRAILDARLKSAQLLAEARKFAEARDAWNAFVARNPLDERAPNLLFQVADSFRLEGKLDEAIASFEGVIARFSGTEAGGHARISLGVLFEEQKQDPARAIEQYLKVPPGNWQAEALRRVAVMESTSLRVVTPRAFRSGEAGFLRISTRNLSRLSFAAYRLDPEAFFRKKQVLKGVEALDVGLVAPDLEWSEPVQGFGKYKPIDADYNLKRLEGPGFWAVKVTDDLALQATTMVLRSDLDAIVKASSDQFLVFVQDRKTGKGRPGARVLISDGKETILEAKTGLDGVVLQNWPAPRDSNTGLSTLILDGQEAAGSGLILSDQVAQGLNPRAYLYTDRPAYRPGQVVHLRGVVRNVRDGSYFVEAGDVGKLEVFEGRGKRILEQAVTLSEFGTFHASLTLAEASPVGTYAVKFTRPNKLDASGKFEVQSYELEKADVRIDLPSPVIYRGEKVQGSVVARYQYGTPLAGRPVVVSLPDGRALRGSTDERGKFPFDLATDGFAQEQTLKIVAQLPSDGVSTSVELILAVRGFRIDLETDRSVYLDGETFRLKARTLDPLGQPTGQALTVSVLKRVEGFRSGEREVSTARVDTDPKTGRGELALKVVDEDGGPYLLRTSGVDRFSNAIFEDRLVQISGKKDASKLRILTDRTSFKVGESARVNLFNRGGNGLALVAWEADRILSYRLVDLATGDNALAWDVDGAEFPNFTLAASKMDDNRLDQARLDVQVVRDLKVEVKPVQPSVGPGEDVVLEVTTLDQLDRPVSAELSLSLVDRALLRLFSEAMPPIGPYFYDIKRVGVFTTAATNAFRYAPVSKPVAAQARMASSPSAVNNPTIGQVGGARGVQGFPVPAVPPGYRIRWRTLTANDLRGDAKDPASTAILAKLGEAIPMNFPTETAIGDVLKSIRANTVSAEFPNGLPIYVDPQGLQDADKTLASTITFDMTGVPLKTTLRLLLEQLSLSYEVSEGLLKITAASNLDIDFTDPDPNTRGIIGGGMGGMGGGIGGMGGGGMGGMGGGGAANVDLGIPRSGFEPISTADLPTPPQEQDAKAGDAVAKAPQAVASPAPALPSTRQQFAETAYWNPSVVTGKDGKARVTFKAPTALSEYVFMARGVTGADTLAGQSTADLLVRKRLFVDLRKPSVLIQGDKPRFSVKVHHAGIVGKVDVRLTSYAGGKQQVDPRTIEVKADGVDEILFDPFEVPDGDVVRIVCSAKGGDQSDEVVVEIPIRPWGVEEVATASGRSSNDLAVDVALPLARTYESPEMVVTIAPTLERVLLDLTDGTEGSGDTTDNRAGDLLASASALRYLKGAGKGDSPDGVRLSGRLGGLVAGLLATQNNDGGWPWVTRGRDGSTSDPMVTARVAWALAEAEALGMVPDPTATNRASAYLSTQLARADTSDSESRTALLHALSLRGVASFEAVNAINRVRDDLSDTSLAYLALTLTRMDRGSMASEVLSLLTRRAKVEAVGAGRAPRRWWSGGKGEESDVETTSLATLAFARVQPRAVEIEGAVDWLQAHRSGLAWSPRKTLGTMVAALSAYYGQAQGSTDRYRLTVRVNGQEVGKVEVEGQADSRTFAVPRGVLKANLRNQVAFDIEGRGTYSYVVTLTGFTRDFGAKPDRDAPLAVRHLFLAADPEFQGRTLPTGFNVCTTATTFENLATQVPQGSRVHVSIRGSGPLLESSLARTGTYLIVEEPLPAGTSLVEGSVRSRADFHRLKDGVLTFYFAPGQFQSSVEYDLYGTTVGQFRVLPTRVRKLDDDGRLALGSPGEIRVLEAGQPVTDPYRPTPDELFARGKALFESGKPAEAVTPLESLSSGFELNEATLKEVARMLLYGHLATYQPRKIVQDFETIREKSPELVIPFETLLTIGRAYADISEFERAYLGWRALAEASYLEDSRVAAVLRQRGKPLEAASFLLGLWRECPDEASIEGDFFGLSRLLASLAAGAESDPGIRDDLAASNVSKADLLAQSARLVRAFLARSPRNPLADEASLALLGDELERKDDLEAVSLAERFARSYPRSRLRDRFRYGEALARFHLGQHDRASALAREIASTDPDQGQEATSNRWQAIYLLGQIHEARGQLAEALVQYRLVSSRFTDAAEAVESLTRRAVKLPDLAVIRPGEPAKPGSEVMLTYRNVAEVEVKVYPVDLMRFTVSRNGLDAVSTIDLAGVRPLAQITLKLGDGSDFEDKTKNLDLPLKDEGAFLVIVRGGSLFASGIVLVSTLDLDVTEQPAGGLLRVTSRDATTGARVPDVQVKVIGSNNGQFVVGQTDLRGVFLAQGLRGTSAIVARQGVNRYALFRGTTWLGPVEAAIPQGAEAGRRQGQTLEDDLRDQNQANRNRQLDRFDKRFQGGMGGMGGGMMGGGFRSMSVGGFQ